MTSERFRALVDPEYPDISSRVYFNAASFGLLPARAVDAAHDLNERRTRPGAVVDSDLPEGLSRARRAAARLVGADPKDIVLAPNTSFGVGLAVACAAAGDPGTIVLSDGEFPANVLPWMGLETRGFTVERIPVDALGRPDEDRIRERVEKGDVRVLAVSSAQFATGVMMDLPGLGEICRRQGTLFAVDAIQSLGVVPLDVTEAGIDILACGAQKWLCSPWGSGFAWVSPALGDRFDPPMISWLGVRGSADFERLLDYELDWFPDGRKFELATLGVQDYVAMAASIELLLELGIDRIREHVHDLHRPILEWVESNPDTTLVTPADPGGRGGILSFRGRPGHIRALRDGGVVCVEREGAIRLSPHFYNRREESEEVVELLEGAFRSKESVGSTSR